MCRLVTRSARRLGTTVLRSRPVEALSFEQLASESEARAFDRAVLASPGIDHFCSSSDWIVPAALALRPGRAPFVRRGQGGGYLALAVGRDHERTWLEPLEAMWGMACPLLGEPAGALAREAAAELAASASELGAVPVLGCGFALGSARLDAWARALTPRYRCGLGSSATERMVASLAGGVDGWLSRRGAGFRRALLRAVRRGEREGVRIERLPERLDAAAASAAYQRMCAVDAATWKAREGVGLGASEMIDFYRVMVPRLAARGALRLAFARLGERDVAYILGGVLGDSYRGLQFGYLAGLERLSLGNLCQWSELLSLTATRPEVQRYDLGAAYDYKRAWAEQLVSTVTLIAFPR